MSVICHPLELIQDHSGWLLAQNGFQGGHIARLLHESATNPAISGSGIARAEARRAQRSKGLVETTHRNPTDSRWAIMLLPVGERRNQGNGGVRAPQLGLHSPQATEAGEQHASPGRIPGRFSATKRCASLSRGPFVITRRNPPTQSPSSDLPKSSRAPGSGTAARHTAAVRSTSSCSI